MPLSFRKSFKIAPGVRLTLGKRSTGVSVGPRHAHVSANTRGRRGLSLSALGFIWRKSKR